LNVQFVNVKENGSVNVESQVCSLELSKRLKELGVKQESLFYYQNQPFNDGTNDIAIVIKEIISTNNGNSITNTYSVDEFDEPIYSAFTVAELGEMLTDNFATWLDNEKLYRNYFFHEIKVNDEYLIEYRINDKPSLSPCTKDKKEADARGKMLIYLLENKLMELPNAT
jgi:hypothetical protein